MKFGSVPAADIMQYSNRVEMKSIIVTLMLAFCPAIALAAPPQNVTAKSLGMEIQAIGPARVLEKYYDTPAWVNSITPGIEGGGSQWLAIAQELHSGADGAAAEDIDLALYFGALPREPFRVIPLLNTIYGGTVEKICTIGFEAEIPKGGVANYLAAIKTKLKAANTKAENAMASACLRGLEQTRIEAEAQGIKE